MRRSIRFGLLLSKAEERALAQLAESEGGLSKGAMVRSLIRQAARERGLWSPPRTAPRQQEGSHPAVAERRMVQRGSDE